MAIKLQLQGSMKADSNGITWKRTGGGRTVEIPRDGK